MLGPPPAGGLAGSRVAADHGLARVGTFPPVDTAAVAATADLERSLGLDGVVSGAHDVAEGGVAATLAEMAVAGGVGFTAARVHDLAELFGESAGRVVVCVAPELLADIEERAAAAGVQAVRLGLATGDRLSVKGLHDVALGDAVDAWRNRLPEALGHGTAQG